MAARSIWKGGMGFGMVNVPCKLYSATDEKSVHFNQLHRDCKSRIRELKFCPTCDRKVETVEIVKGYEVGKDQYVLMEEADFAAVRLNSLKAMEVMEFVDGGQVDPRHYDASYFVAPDEAGVKAFSLFLQAMGKVGMVGVVKLTFKTKEKLAVIRPFGKLILLQTLFYADELRPSAEIEVKLPEVSERELNMGIQLIKALGADTVDMAKYRDQYRDALLKVIEAKLNNLPLPVEAPTAKKEMDLVDALMASLNAAAKAKQPVGVA